MIYIVRHGQTEQNQKKKLQGRSNYPLSDFGKDQALTVGKAFREAGIRFDKVYSSPLTRALQTAELIGNEAPVETEERLIEMDYGPYEGAELSNPAPELRVFFQDFVHNPAPEGMEPLSDVVSRTGAFLEELKDSMPQGNVLISTHAIAMKGILEYLTPESEGAYWSKYIGNCAVYRTELTEDGYAVPEEVEITQLPITK